MSTPTRASSPGLTNDEGGLRPPPGLSALGRAWWWFHFLVLVKLARLRFIGILVAIGFVITQWDTLIAYHDKWTRPAHSAHAAASDVEYFCPMHPSVVRDNGKEKCPICFMPLSRRKKGNQSEAVLPAGVVNRVQLSPYRLVLAGVRTSQVTAMPVTKEINAIGYVEFNERKLKTVSARVKGRLDELFVNETGQMVAADDVLASLYSPDLNVTVQNLLDAQKRNSRELIASSRHRLQLLGISDQQIDDIVKSGKANSHLRITTPISGHVIKKYVREGQYVEEGSPLYDVADLSSVWIQAQVYEDDMAFLPVDQLHSLSADDPAALAVTATTQALPGEVFRGRLDLVYPHVDQQSRTVTVRFELPNPGHKLRPGMTATVTLLVPPSHLAQLRQAAAAWPYGTTELEAGRVLVVPDSAVIDTGSQTIVYREASPGVFEGVQVRLGPKMIGPDNVRLYPLLIGLQPGDTIVSSGSFLVDAETRLNPAAGSIYFGGSDSGGTRNDTTVTTVRPSTPEDEDRKRQAALQKLAPADRTLVEKQRFCPILENSRLGSMGTPVKLTLNGQSVFLCCPACEAEARKDPEQTIEKVNRLKTGAEPAGSSSTSPVAPKSAAKEEKIQAALAKLGEADRRLAEAQKFCPILADSRLGSMGKPIKLMLEGQPVFVCCAACEEAARAQPKETAARVQQLIKAAATRDRKAAP